MAHRIRPKDQDRRYQDLAGAQPGEHQDEGLVHGGTIKV